ncbi:MAG: hypothetical protein ABJP70_09020 [Erythrobacter sp.]
MFKNFGSVSLGVAALGVAACNPMAELGDADEEVAKFHKDFGAKNFEGIWADSHQAMQDSGTREQFDATFASLSQYWGKVKTTERESFSINTNNGVTTVKVTHNTEFDAGSAVEDFNFIRDDDVLKLAGYTIDTKEQAEAAKKEADEAKEKEDAEEE